MKFIYEIFPVFLFFIAFKYGGIYTATVVGIIATTLQVLLTKLFLKKWDTNQLVTLVVFILFGGMTLYFHNPIFVKWKPTIVFWIFTLVIIFTHFTKKPIVQRIFQNVIDEKALIPSRIWRQLNIIWGLFFLILGSFNLYVAYTYSDAAWVNFKFYGISSALILLSIFQAIYLLRYLPNKVTNRKNDT